MQGPCRRVEAARSVRYCAGRDISVRRAAPYFAVTRFIVPHLPLQYESEHQKHWLLRMSNILAADLMKITLALVLVCPFATIQGMAFQARHTPSQHQSAEVRFDVVSIRSCNPNATAGGTRVTPGRIYLECSTAESLIRTAFLTAGVLPHEAAALVKGGPSWVRASRFTIEAVTEKPIITADTSGPLLQDILKRRFKLKTREGIQTLKVYDLIQSRGGAKLRTSMDGSCFQLVAGKPQPHVSGGKAPPPICGGFRQSLLGEVDVNGITMDSFCKRMAYALDRDVIDKTGLQGAYDFHLETTLDALSFFNARQASLSPKDTDNEPSGSLFTAVRKLGLRLITGTRPTRVIAIDHIEMPDAN
jgi:uncharacterized protein (TIGR03435 family)